MSRITTKDATRIYYKDWGTGQAIVFSHGRSEQASDGNDMDTYADDLAALIAALDLRDIIRVGQSTGGGEVAVRITFIPAARLIGE